MDRTEIEVQVEFTDGYRERYTEAVLKVLEKRKKRARLHAEILDYSIDEEKGSAV